MNIKKIYNKISKNYKDFVKKYLFTNIGLLFFTFYAIIFEFNGIEESLFLKIVTPFICFNFLIESIVDINDKKRVYLYLLSFTLSIILGCLIPFENQILVNFYYGINIISILIGLHYITKDEKNIPNYVCKVFYNLFKVELFTLVLLFGLAIVYIIVESLIIEGYEVMFYSKIMYFIIGLYNIPFSIMSLIYTKDEVPDIINTMIRRVLLFILDISYLVMISYLIKILVTNILPENEIFVAVLLLFVFSLPMFIMLENYKGKIEMYNYKYLPYVMFLPIFLQIYSLVIRLTTYGFTSSRYIGIFVIVFEIVSLILLLYKNKKLLKYDFLVMAGIVLILFVLPYVNMYEAPLRFQINRLEAIWSIDTKEDNIPRSDRQKIKDIYEYLNEYDDADKFMPKHLNMEKINRYLMNTRGEFEGITNDYFLFKNDKTKIDISSYNTMESFYYSASRVSLNNILVAQSDVTFNITNDIKGYMRNSSEFESLIFENDDNNKLFVTDLSFYYNEDENILENFEIIGYILYR